MMRATYRGMVLAQAPRTVRVEGTHYFPSESVQWDLLTDSSTKTLCPWKGIARYHNLVVGDQPDVDDVNLAWRYPKPSPLARMIKNHVAFSPQVRVEGAQEGPGALRRLRDRLTG